MKFLKSFLAVFAMLALTSFAPAKADVANDVDSSFWANTEITDMVSKNIMTLDEEGNFNPEGAVQRGDFVRMLIKVLGHTDLTVNVNNPYSDINVTTPNYNSIMKSEEIGLVYGYPGGVFKPANKMTKAEVTSVMSHITKNMVADVELLSQFTDADSIPAWAKSAYAKTTKYGLYVNYPDALQFEPARDITRAETAVLLYKLSQQLNLVKTEYVPEEVTSAVEHLNIHRDAESNIVTITNMKKIIASGNILKAEFADVYKSKNSVEGDEVVFVIRNDVVTDEGTTVIPGGSKLYANVEDIVNPRWFNKNGKVKLHFSRLELPDGRVADVNGYVYNNKDGYLMEGPWKKLVAYTLGGAAIGTAAGVGGGLAGDDVGMGFAIGTPSGAGAGTLLGLITKGLTFKAKPGETVFIKLLSNVDIAEAL